MTAKFFIVEIHPGLFQSPSEVKVIANYPQTGWRFFAECSTDDIASCTLLYGDIPSSSYTHFVEFWKYLLEVGKAGQPWQNIFQDGKAFHLVHNFNTNDKNNHPVEIRVSQFKRKKIRILFIYVPEKRLIAFVSHAFEKNTPKTESVDKNRAEKTINRFLTAVNSGNIAIISQQMESSRPNPFILTKSTK